MLNLSEPFDDRFLRRARAFSRGAAVFVMAVGVSALAGWVFDVFRLKAFYAGIAMKANTALSLLLAGASLLLLNFRSESKALRISGQVCAVIVAVIGLLTLSEHIVGWDLHIDQLLFKEAPGAWTRRAPAVWVHRHRPVSCWRAQRCCCSIAIVTSEWRRVSRF